MNRVIIFILVIFFGQSIFSQAKLADILYNNFEYELAAKYYKNADSLSNEQLKNHALCFYLNNEFKKAVPLFEKALKKDTGNRFLKYHYGVSLKSTGRYITSKKVLGNLYKIDSFNPYLKLHLNSIDSLMKWDTIQFFKKLAGYDQLNSGASEFSPSFYDQGIYYIIERGDEEYYKSKNINLIANNDTISPKEKKQFTEKLNTELTYGTTISPRTYIYKTGIDVSQLFKDYSDPVPLSAIDTNVLIVTHKGFNVTSYSTNHNGEKVFYTRHPVKNKWNPDASINPLMYLGKQHTKKPKLKRRRRLAIKFLPSTFGSGEVSTTANGKTVYFVSDKRKSLGGTDIYVAHKKKTGRWGKAINLGPLVNTPFNEESPRIYDDSILYFSSNGWPGYGKADIFNCKIIDDSVFHVRHLPYPVNSSGDDIHFALHPFDESIGILNSDRARGKGDEDIYFAYMIPVEPYVKGYVRSLSDSSILKDCFVRLTNEKKYELDQTTTRINGVYRFSLDKDSTYRVIATRVGFAGYITVSANETLFRNEKRDIFLDTAITIQGYVIDEKKEKVNNAKVEFFDQKDNLVHTVFSREDGYFQIATEEDEEYYIMATKDEKVGNTKLKIHSKYKTDSLLKIMIYNHMAIIHGIVYDTNGLPSENAVVRLLDSTNSEVERITTKKDGEYQLSMTSLHQYRIIATNYEMSKDTAFFVGTNWGPKQRKDLYLVKTPTVQGYTYFKDSVKILDDVEVSVESGYDSKYITILSDKKGFFQFPLFNDSLLYMDGVRKKMKGTTTVDVDSNYNSIAINNIYLHRTTTDAHGIVIYANDSIADSITVELIDKNGKIVSKTTTDSMGRFYFELNTDTDYEIYASSGELEAIENIHTGILWRKTENIIMKLGIKGTPTFGLVVDASDRSPLSFVKITLTDSATNLKNITYTNDQGKFEMSLKKNSTNYIKLEKDNYYPKTLVITIGDTVPRTIDLSRDYNLDLIKSGFKIDPIYFEFDSHDITRNSKIELDKLANWLTENKDRTCSVYGYTDCRGDQNYNLWLSEKRAESVRNYLIYKGINAKRTFNIPRGATNYVNNCYRPEQCTEAEHRENRRCEFEINDIK